jgi:hypothetical protein
VAYVADALGDLYRPPAAWKLRELGGNPAAQAFTLERENTAR